MKVYIIVSKKSKGQAEIVRGVLAGNGWDVYAPYVHTPQTTAHEIYMANYEAIKKTDLVIAIFGSHYGKDTTAKIGLARGMGKIIVGIGTPDETDIMSVQAVDKFITECELKRLICFGCLWGFTEVIQD